MPKGSGTGSNTYNYDNGYQSDEIELTEREEKEIQENLTAWLAVMANVDKELTVSLGHQFEEMILRCTMKSNNCTNPKYVSLATCAISVIQSFATINRYFDMIFTPTEGNCFRYTSLTYVSRKENRKGRKSKFEWKERQPVETSLAGVDHGLELVLNLEVSEYLPGTSQIGALVMVHAPDDFGTSASEAIFVAPERATYIGLKMVNITRLPDPYPEHCTSYWPEGMNGSLTLNASYSQQACLKICLQRSIESKCKCQVRSLMFFAVASITQCISSLTVGNVTPA